MEKLTEQRLLSSLDADTPELLEFLPYLLQDLRELGSFPEAAARAASRLERPWSLSVLEPACGKGAVGIRLAKELGCRVRGCDIVSDFVRRAGELAAESGTEHLCSFETGDAREMLKGSEKYDLVVFAAGGDILGGPEETLEKLKKATALDGHILLEDGYADSELSSKRPDCPIWEQWNSAFERQGLTAIACEKVSPAKFERAAELNTQFIERRAAELSERITEKAELFAGYVEGQKRAAKELTQGYTAAVWLLERNAIKP